MKTLISVEEYRATNGIPESFKENNNTRNNNKTQRKDFIQMAFKYKKKK